MNDYIISLIRTVVPIGLGIVVAWLANVGVDIDETEVIQAVTGVVIALYYGLVRALETKFPWIGWFLGMPKPPVYNQPEE